MSIHNKHPRDYRLIDVVGGWCRVVGGGQQKFIKETKMPLL